ncbi:hypothetical protein [Williamsia sp. M5A3_1d]
MSAVTRVPNTIWVGFGAMLAAAVVCLVSAVMLISWVLDLKGQATNAADGLLSEDPTGISSAQVGSWAQNVATSVSLTIAGLMIATASVYVVIAFLTKAGRNGARVTATVLAAFSVFGFLLGPLAIAIVMLGVFAVVMLWLPQSSAYFRSRRAIR